MIYPQCRVLPESGRHLMTVTAQYVLRPGIATKLVLIIVLRVTPEKKQIPRGLVVVSRLFNLMNCTGIGFRAKFGAFLRQAKLN